MTKKGSSKIRHIDDLRKQAEKRIPKTVENISEMSADEIQRLIHELQVHQIELEMQNEELRRSQMELAETRLRYSALYDFAPIGYFTLDINGTILEANVTGASLLGFEKRSLTGEPFRRFISPEYFSIFQSHLQKAIEIDNKQTCKLKLSPKDGSLFDALIEAVAVMNVDGEFCHYRVSVNDITDMARAEEEIASLARFLSEAPHPLLRLSGDGLIIYANAACRKLLSSWGSETGGCVPEPLRGIVAEAFSKGSHTAMYMECGARSYSFTVVPITDAGYVNLYGRDVTEAKKIEKALQETKDRYLHIVEDSTEMIARGGIEGILTFVNDAWLRNLGGDKSAYIGHNIREFIPPEDQEKIGPLVSQFNPGKISREIESQMILPSGESRWYLWSIQAIYDRKGRFIEFQGVGRDITDRKRVEKMLEERTARLEEINKELETFSYSVSHDLRAPLRAIDGYARMILNKQGDKFDEDTLRKFNEIRSGTQTMGRLIDDLLALSHLSRKDLSMHKLDMADIIRDVWQELETIYPDRDMTLTIHSLPPGHGDRTLIKQLYANLLENAVKFTKDRDAAHIEAGGYVNEEGEVYYVRDNGIGFDMAYYDKLFGIFQRLHSPTDYEGTGVGLATVQRIVHRHGGRVWAEGKVDEGACFYFTLAPQS